MQEEKYRGFLIKGDGEYGHKTIHIQRGNIPNCLEGFYTTSKFAKTAIDVYLGIKKG